MNTSLPTIDVIEAGRDILGDITIESGTINRIEALRYISPASLGDPFLHALGLDVDTIRAVRIDGGVYLHDPDPATTGGNLRLLETTGSSAAGASGGRFYGLLSVGSISGAGGGVLIGGDLVGSITILEQPFAGLIRVGRSYNPASSGVTGEINFYPTSGLVGQVVFNASDVGGVWGTGSTISVNQKQTVLANQPYYTNTAASIGGGSVGLASFHLHESSCAPPNDTTYVVRRSGTSGGCVQNPDPVMRFYGAVIIASTGYYAYVEEYVGGGTWVRVDWDHEPVFVAGGDTAERTVRVKRDSSGSVWPTGYYRISARSGKLLCKNVGQSGSEPQVASFYYYLLMVDDCEEELLATYDLNEDGAVTVGGDLSAWAAAPSDVNSDGSVNAGDAQSVITAAGTWAAMQPN